MRTSIHLQTAHTTDEIRQDGQGNGKDRAYRHIVHEVVREKVILVLAILIMGIRVFGERMQMDAVYEDSPDRFCHICLEPEKTEQDHRRIHTHTHTHTHTCIVKWCE